MKLLLICLFVFDLIQLQLRLYFNCSVNTRLVVLLNSVCDTTQAFISVDQVLVKRSSDFFSVAELVFDLDLSVPGFELAEGFVLLGLDFYALL